MPNIKRRFADDDPSSDEEDDQPEEDEPQHYRGAGKALRMPGGKGMGKQLRAPAPASSSSSEDDDDEEEEEPVRVVHRAGGKQLRPPGGGKQLRAPQPQEDSDDDDDDDEEEEDVPVRPVARGGGKSLIRMQAPPEDEDSEDSDDDDEEEAAPVRPVGGGKALRPPRGGKQLRAPAPVDDSDDDDDDDDEEEEQAVAPVRPPGGGKTLRPPRGGKQLRAPAPVEDSSDDDDEEEEEEAAPIRPPGGGKTLRPPRGGKQLRAPAPVQDSDDDDDDDDDGEEDDAPKTTRVVQRGGGKSLVRMAAPEEPDEEDSEEESVPAKKETKKAAAKPKPTPRGGKQLRRPPPKEESEEDDDDDEDDDDMDLDSEEEEAPVKPRRSTRATKVEQESSEEESSDEEAELDMETFDTQRLVKDEEDQKYLDSLNEIEREAILAERFEKRKAEMDMKKVLREQKKAEKAAKKKTTVSTKKRKAAPAKKPTAKRGKSKVDEDEELAKSLAGKRESGRNKDASGKKAEKAKALAALREERKKATRKEESESESDFGDDDEDSDDDYEESGTALKPWQKKANEKRSSRLDQVGESDDDMDEDDAMEKEVVVVEADLEDYQKITLPRRRLGRWCNEPYFKDAVMNCYVKLFIGVNEEGKRCYRLCRIVGITSSQTYSLPPAKNHKPVSTDKMLKLKFGANVKEFPISLVSDAKADQADVTQYVTAMKSIRQRVLGKREAAKMRKQQDKLVNDYVYTTEDIEANIRNRKKKGETAANLALQRTHAAIGVQGARAALEDVKFQLKNAKNSEEIKIFEEEVAKAEKELEEKLHEEQLVLDLAKSRKQRLAGRTKDQKWAKVNKRALEINQKVDRGEMAAQEDEKGDSNAKESFNPYARRKVKPKILWEVGQKDEAKDGEDMNGAEASKDQGGEGPAEKETEAAPLLVQEQQHKAAALSQSHQFAIDEEVLAQASLSKGIAGLGSKQIGVKRVRRGLSLAEYQERKAAGTL